MTMTVAELAEEVRESNRRLAEEVHNLRADFADFRVEVSEKLGSINANLEGFRGRTDTAFKVAGWGVTLAAGVALSVVGSVIAGTWYAAKLDSRVGQVESRLDKS